MTEKTKTTEYEYAALPEGGDLNDSALIESLAWGDEHDAAMDVWRMDVESRSFSGAQLIMRDPETGAVSEVDLRMD